MDIWGWPIASVSLWPWPGISTRKIMSGAYLVYYLRQDSQIWCVDTFGVMEFRILFPVYCDLALDLWPLGSRKFVSREYLLYYLRYYSQIWYVELQSVRFCLWPWPLASVNKNCKKIVCPALSNNFPHMCSMLHPSSRDCDRSCLFYTPPQFLSCWPAVFLFQ